MLNFTFLGRDIELVKVQPVDYWTWTDQVYSLLRNKYQYNDAEIEQLINELDAGEGVALYSLYGAGKTSRETAQLLSPH